ncbi:MAG: hypothetical protein KGH98_02735 [Candidatus Micrarchaeota archaeon]|nr:hypothetical protein [Candidatus Micrarchaeota archaeon]
MPRSLMVWNLDTWTLRFIYSALGQGLVFVALTMVLFVYGSISVVPAPAQVIAFGSAGTWILAGYLSYLIMIIYLGVTALFYYYIGKVDNGFRGSANVSAWVHFILVNIGITGACLLLVYAGYIGGAGLMPTAVGGHGLTDIQVHEQLIGMYPYLIIPFVISAVVGALFGGLSYLLALRKR